jgi:hypothetical protein
MRAKTVALIAVCALALTGCAPVGLDGIMGRSTSGTPTTEPQTAVHCDLIFPPASVNP